MEADRDPYPGNPGYPYRRSRQQHPGRHDNNVHPGCPRIIFAVPRPFILLFCCRSERGILIDRKLIDRPLIIQVAISHDQGNPLGLGDQYLSSVAGFTR
jgi:hypothetical protein